MNDVFELCGLIDFQRAKTAAGNMARRLATQRGTAPSLPKEVGAAVGQGARIAGQAVAAPVALAGQAGQGFAEGLTGKSTADRAAASAAQAAARTRAGNRAGAAVGKQWGIGTGAGRFLTNMSAGRAAGLSALAGGAVSLLTKDKDESALGAAAGGALKGMALGTPALLGARSVARGAGGYNARLAAGPSKRPLSKAPGTPEPIAPVAPAASAPVRTATEDGVPAHLGQDKGAALRKIALGPTPPKLIRDLRAPTALQPKGSHDLLSNGGKDLFGKRMTERTPALAPGESLLSEKGKGIFHGAEKLASLAGGDFYVFLLADGASFIGEYAGKHSDETLKVALHLPGVAPELCLLDIADVADLRPLVKQANGLPINRREDVSESVEGQKLAAAYIEMQKEAKAPAKDTSNTDEKATSKKPPFEVPALKAKLTSAGLAR